MSAICPPQATAKRATADAAARVNERGIRRFIA
jgi:hypothetical protein